MCLLDFSLGLPGEMLRIMRVSLGETRTVEILLTSLGQEEK